MSNDTTPPQDQATGQQPAPLDFNATAWHVLVGIRDTSDPANPSDLTSGLMFGMACTPEVMEDSPQGPRPDKTNEAVHFAQWLDSNKEHLVALWRTEYAQYMNLRLLTMRREPGLKLVSASGEKLQ